MDAEQLAQDLYTLSRGPLTAGEKNVGEAISRIAAAIAGWDGQAQPAPAQPQAATGEPVQPMREGSTHWEGCLESRGHHACAIAEITCLREQIAMHSDHMAAVHKECDDLRERVRELEADAARWRVFRERDANYTREPAMNFATGEVVPDEDWFWTIRVRLPNAALLDTAVDRARGAKP